MASVFYSLSEKILMEIDYTQIPINNQQHQLEIVHDDNSHSISLVNKESGILATNNVSTTSLVTNNISERVLLGKNTAYYYPNVDSNVYVTPITPVNVSLNYITIRFHVMSGYNFQDCVGATFSLYVKDTNGNRIYLLNQAFQKSEINRYKYSQTPKKIGINHYDKYIEFNVIDYDDVINGTINKSFFNGVIGFSNDNVLYATSTKIQSVSYENGYPLLNESDGKTISFAPKDEFSLLTADISEHEDGYFQYMAGWNGQPIENMLFRLNSISGNDYYVIHDLEFYEQRGNSFYLADSITTTQTNNYDKPKKIRPIISTNANGGLKVIYTVRLFNKANGDSIIKQASLSTLNITPYLEKIGKLNITQLGTAPKVYNKIVNNNINITKNGKLNKILVPIYVNSFNAQTNEDFKLKLHQFDNVYEIRVFNVVDGEKSIYHINPVFKHILVFVKENGNRIEVKEIIDNAKRNVGVLTFKITSDVASVIKSNNIQKFSINVKSENIETSLLTGDVNYQ